MHPADIKAGLQKKGMPQAAIARALNVRPPVVSQVINGHCSSRRIARRIAAVLNKPVAELWPGRYPDLELAELRRRRVAA